MKVEDRSVGVRRVEGGSVEDTRTSTKTARESGWGGDI